jgi:hypothetical protein
LDKTGEFTLIGGVKYADKYPVFEDAVDSGRADGQELFADGGDNAESRPGGDDLIGIDFLRCGWVVLVWRV